MQIARDLKRRKLLLIWECNNRQPNIARMALTESLQLIIWEFNEAFGSSATTGNRVFRLAAGLVRRNSEWKWTVHFSNRVDWSNCCNHLTLSISVAQRFQSF